MGKAGNHYAAYAYPPAGAPAAYPPYGGGYASMPAPPGYPARPLPPAAAAAHRKPDNGKPDLPVAYIALRYLLVYPALSSTHFFVKVFITQSGNPMSYWHIILKVVFLNLWLHIVLHVPPCKGIALVVGLGTYTPLCLVGII